MADKKGGKKAVKTDYVFKHPNKFLTIATLGVQFIDGTFITKDRELAIQLVEFADMELIDQP